MPTAWSALIAARAQSQQLPAVLAALCEIISHSCAAHFLIRSEARHLLKTSPFFPTRKGGVCTKEAMTETFCAAARTLGVPLESADGSEYISGHTLRVTGAQGLAGLGLDLWAIQLFGR